MTLNNTGNFYATAFTFQQVIQYNSFVVIFDQYRIDSIECWIYLKEAGNTGATIGLQFYSVVDYDNAQTPSNLSTLQQYTNVVCTPLTNGHYVKWKPHVANALYSGSAFTDYGNIPSSWIDSASSDVAHYGIKLGVENTATSALHMNMIVRYHFSCRNVY
jgi:hypothetical protein